MGTGRGGRYTDRLDGAQAVEDTLREERSCLAETRRELQATIDKLPALVASLAERERDFVNLTWQRLLESSQEERAHLRR